MKAWLFFRPRVVTCKRVTISLSRSKALLIKSNRNICPFVIRHGFVTLKMRTASFLPCIRLEKSDAGSAFSTVTEFTVNRNMPYSPCYKRPLTDYCGRDIVLFCCCFFVFFASYPALNNDFGCRIQIKKKNPLAFSIIYNLYKTHLK